MLTRLTRKKMGYPPGSLMDAVYLYQDIVKLDIESRLEQTSCDDLLSASSEFEDEARRLGDQLLLTNVLLQRSDILLANQRYPEAIAALTAADQALGNLRQHDLKVSVYAKLAEAHACLKDWRAVSEICEKGISLVETYRYEVNGQYLQSAYFRSRIGLYARGAQAAYERKDYQQMLLWAELSKCRSVLRRRQESSTPSEEEKRTDREFRQVCQQIDAARAAGNGKAPDALLAKRRILWDLLLIQRAEIKTKGAFPEFNLAAVQAALDPDEAALYYFWLNPHTLLIVVIDQRQCLPELISIKPQERTALERFSHGVLESLTQNRPDYLNYVDQERRFATFLLPPSLTDCLKTKRRLLISPHHLLHALPFQALPWDEEYRYLIQRFAITYIPNLSSLLLRYQSPARHRLLALGVGAYRVPGYQLPALKEAEMETLELHRLYKENGYEIDAFTGADACEALLRRLEQTDELSAYTILHIASHGYNVNSDTPMESYLFLHDSMLEGLRIANWRLGAEVVALSACCSGQRAIGGRGMSDLPGDDLFGLQAAFFAAGAKRVLGLLWPVHTEVAYTIMIAFHRFLVVGQAPELALQSAIVEYLKNAGPRFRKSFFWAPFFLSAMGRPHRRPHHRQDEAMTYAE